MRARTNAMSRNTPPNRPWRIAFTFVRIALCILLLAEPLAAHALPKFDDVRMQWRSSDWLLLSRDGVPLQRTRIDKTERRGDWVALADVSPALREAIVVSEDKRFYEHSGVDWRGAAAAAWANLWNTRTRGASTVTMQLTGLLNDDRERSGQRSIARKANQAVSALWLEHTWRKDQILEAYLNLVPFRGETIGLSALSITLFGKAPSGLDEREAAVAAALIRAPNAPYAKVAERACRILRDMQAPERCVNLAAFVQLAFARPAPAWLSVSPDAPTLAPHFARRIASETHPVAGARVTSTLDAKLQRFASDTLTRTLVELNAPAHPRNVHDGAVVVLDNATGDVLAWVGSSGGLSGARDVDAVLARRQAGSTLKPFLYAQAIDERRLTTASLLDDAPLDLAAGGGLYIPQNYDKDFKGWVSVRTALGSSLNVPAVRTLVMVTPHRFAKTLTALGLPLEQSGDYYGYSLALGSADVTLLSLTNAYRALANGGLATPAFDLPRRKPPAPLAQQRVFSADASYIITTVLADNNARTRTFGFDSPLATRFFSAVKTGTSKDMRDNWTVGYTSRYTVGVWVGNADGQPMWDVSGVTGAAPIWAAIVGYLHRRMPSAAPRAPAGVVETRVRFDGNIEPARNEWFVDGTQTQTVGLAANAVSPDDAGGIARASGNAAASASSAAPRIGSPTNGTLFALDPDIPATRQRVVFERASGTSGRASWRLDGKPLGGEARVLWLPWPGRHLLELVNADGSSADSVRFEVRGATAHQAVPPHAGKPGTAHARAASQPSQTSPTSPLQDSTTNGQKL
ncbi:Multimodular transpeptidase-transglycosylase [Paraburkholderia caribensis MBA4]|uniref:peptidoglycan glycosyltransferase n=1 Tax=Paraburkholderia caribensis MBA4 TaxID=1323664 RepID=A0A0P0R9R2_9BURK|nr:penicillin-binding protein 1C [Paraburkholderia caribensis]ALL65092.1 Multimodular transpeptidase-transglycosylase [Paraburkholderia caribensis MBA4]